MDQDAVINSSPEPSVAAGLGRFRIKVLLKGTFVGWWISDGPPEHWISITDNEAAASVWYWVAHKGATYLAAGTNDYLSYRVNNPSKDGLKMRGWTYAAKWEKEGDKLRCVDNGQLVGMDGRHFYCNGQNVVEFLYPDIDK